MSALKMLKNAAIIQYVYKYDNHKMTPAGYACGGQLVSNINTLPRCYLFTAGRKDLSVQRCNFITDFSTSQRKEC